MLDSTGSRWDKTVECTFCPREVRVTLYKPEVGHDGYTLPDLGPYVELTSNAEALHAFFGGALFIISEIEGKLGVELYILYWDSNPYSYGGPVNRVPRY